MVTAVARKGDLEYAFYRGTTFMGPQQRFMSDDGAPAASQKAAEAPNQPPGESLDSNLKSQNSTNNLKQLKRLQERYNQPAEMRKGAHRPAAFR